MTNPAEQSRRFQLSSRPPRQPLARGRAVLVGAAAGALMVLSVTAASATSTSLPPGGNVPASPTTAATEPDLAGTVIRDTLVSFTIKTAGGKVLCTGRLQDRVVRSTKTGRFHFYYRIRNTKGPGAINRIDTTSFAGHPLEVGYRTDGLGTVPPRVAMRSGAPGEVVTFELPDPPISCARHQESRFILIKTDADAFHTGGKTRIVATSGAQVTVPTVMP